MDKTYSINIPTYARHQNLHEQVEWLLDMEPAPETLLITHAENEWTQKFDFSIVVDEYDEVELNYCKVDEGLVDTKYVSAFDNLDTDFIFVCDDDIFPGKEYIDLVFDCYEEKPGIYGGIGFHYGRNHFEGRVYGGTYEFDAYYKEDEITCVDAPGQSFFFNWNDIGGRFDESDFPEWACKFCSDDLKLAFRGWEQGTKSYVVPHKEEKNHKASVYRLEEGDIEKQSLVGGGHPDSSHKNQLVSYYTNQKGYTRVLDR